MSNFEENLCKEIYHELNSNGDGKISFDSFKVAFWSRGSNRSEMALKQAYDAADLNKDGIIDEDALCGYFAKKN